jgi:type II secretory pathway component GspD/PulD (secretin)
MTLHRNGAARRTKNLVRMFALPVLALAVFATGARAQAQPKDSEATETHSPQTYQTLYLTNPVQETDAREIITDLRNMLPNAKLYYVPSQNAISMLGTTGDLQLAKQILSDIDRARKTYRLTYTITDTDNGQTLGTRHVDLVVASGGTAELKQGTRVPIVTGTYNGDSARSNTQVQYLDVGLMIEASLNGAPDDLRLHTRIEQSSVADEHSGLSVQDPVIRQTELKATSTLAPGKPSVLGSLDIPDTARHMEIEVSSEPVQ